jgi:hypothetical protein
MLRRDEGRIVELADPGLARDHARLMADPLVDLLASSRRASRRAAPQA